MNRSLYRHWFILFVNVCCCCCLFSVIDWYPKHIEVQQEEHDVIVTFNLAPPHFGINRYFSLCYGEGRQGGGGLKRYIIKPVSESFWSNYFTRLRGEWFTVIISLPCIKIATFLLLLSVEFHKKQNSLQLSSPRPDGRVQLHVWGESLKMLRNSYSIQTKRIVPTDVSINHSSFYFIIADRSWRGRRCKKNIQRSSDAD